MTLALEKPARATVRRRVAAAVVLFAAAAAVVVAPAVANAATGCTFQSGKTSNLATGVNGVHPVSGTIFTKQPPGCLDLNLTKVSAADSYEGWLFNSSTDRWSACSRGFVSSKNLPVVLCSSVATGTEMAIVQESNTQRTVTAEF